MTRHPFRAARTWVAGLCPPRRGALGLTLLTALLLLLAPLRPAVAAVNVATTTQDLTSLVEAVGGALVQVASLVPPGADAEAYEPRPGDLLRLEHAAIVVRIGIGYDEWLDRLLAQHGDARLMIGGPGHVDTSTGIALLDVQSRSIQVPSGGHAHGLANPHYWLDPANARSITGSILKGLARAAPEHTAQFVANRQKFLAAFDERMRGWQARLAPYAGVPVIVYHNGWPYFARRFHINVVEPKEDVPPSTMRMAKISAQMRTEKVRLVLIRSLERRETAQAIAERGNARVALLAGSVGELPGADDYVSLFDTDIRALLAELRQHGS